MKIKFKQINDEQVLVIGITETGEEKEIGHIFTPSSSGHDILNAIQICGFSEAFDLWGCAMYKTAKLKEQDTQYIFDEKTGKKIYQYAKDIQLMFSIDTQPIGRDFGELSNCWGCFNNPCTCEVKVKHENPYVVKREQDLSLTKLKKEENK